MMHDGRTPNRLINETSPYLLQHAYNPVEWYAWGAEALDAARTQNKPILLSVGYSACHWCHVMERESFENDETARVMNENFINIKVDREERPDIDSIYMEAVQAMTGHGGWPMTMFLTPEGAPFYGGTYFPPEPRHGMPAFRQILQGVAQAYQERPDDVATNAAQLREHLAGTMSADALAKATRTEGTDPADAISPRSLERAYASLTHQYDELNGGFGSAPKFPPAMALDFLLRYWRRTGENDARMMVEHTLQAMANGGMYDQLGGGFHRYSTDAVWLVPHFEKMLYDNALLARVYVAAWQATTNPFYKRIAEETLDYVAREMIDPTGAFYSTQDADSEGEEGKFFVWTPQEVAAALADPQMARLVSRYWDVSAQGNFEGKNILHVIHSATAVAQAEGVSAEALPILLTAARARLFVAREPRVHPARDEKTLTAWNGLMLRAFAEAGRALDRQDYIAVATKNAEFVLSTLRRDDGRLLRTYKEGRVKLDAFLEDYAFYATGLLALYEATFDLRWLTAARELADTIIAHYADEAEGTFFDTADDGETLISRPKSLYDNAIPSGNSTTAELLLRLALFTGDDGYRTRAERLLTVLAPAASRLPNGFGNLLCALDFALDTPFEIAFVAPGSTIGTEIVPLVRVVADAYLPNKVVMARSADGNGYDGWPLLKARPARDGTATAYVCQNYACREPVTTPNALAKQLGA